MSHIFISYSRKDINLAGKIVQALADNNLDTWIDWKSIPKGEDWEQEIYRGIEEADAFLFLISPDSVASQMCNKEIDHAVKNGKRILPIVICDTDPKVIHPEISKRNWIFCRDEQDDFNKAIEETRKTIHTDYKWLKYHTELQVKALKWEEKKDNSRLLRGKELREAEQQLANSGSQKDPQSTQLQRQYILYSQRNEIRTRRQITIGLVVGLIIMVVFSFVAWGQRNSAINAQNTAVAEANAKATALVNEENARATAQAEKVRAEEQSNIALARQLAAQAQTLFVTGNSKQMTAMLLAIQSMHMLPSDEATQVLQNNTLAISVTRIIQNSAVNSVAFSPDGEYIASGSDDNTVRVWDTSAGREIAHFTHDSMVTAVAFSSDGKYIVSGSYDNTARVWEAHTGKEIARMTHDNGVIVVVFSPDGKYVASGSLDDTARIWDLSTGKEITRVTFGDGDGICCNYVESITFSPDGKYVVSGSLDNTVRVWDASTGKEITRMTHDNGVNSVAFSPDGKYVASGSWDNTARVWDASTGKEITRMTHDNGVNSVAFSPDGKYVASGSWDNTARVWDASTGKEIIRMTHDNRVTSVAFSPDGKYVASGSWDNTARVWDTSTGKEITRMTHDDEVTSLAFSPDGNYIASGSWDNTTRVWETITRKEVIANLSQSYEIDASNKNSKYNVFFSCASHFISGRCADSYILVKDANTDAEIVNVMHDGEVTAAAVSPDGKYVISGSDDNTARIWEVSTGKEIIRMTHDGEVTAVAFSPDGKYVVSGSDDNTTRVWDASTGKEIARLVHDKVVTKVVFSKDGIYVFLATQDDSTRKWLWRPNDLISLVCLRVTRNLTRAEWQQYIGDALPYQAVCPNLPIEPEVIITPTP